uniref:F-box domain-containing protein n=1 Tax=Caenorhabditis tropicalis TaxID=1561998 RepID=A0A1I7UDN0_9PELO
MDPPFPILRLPHVALAEVLDLLEIEEQVVLAMCSQRANTVVKCNRNRRRNPKIVVNYQSCVSYVYDDDVNDLNPLPLIHVHNLSEKSSMPFGHIEKVKIGSNLVDIWIDKNDDPVFLNTFWEDEYIGKGIVTDYLCDLFGVDLFMLTVGAEHGKVVESFQGRSIEILSVYDTHRVIHDDAFHYILTKAKVKHLFVENWSDDVQLNDIHHNHFDTLNVSSGYWLTIDYLMRLDCVEIHIGNQPISNEELNQFLMNWINGGSPRLKLFHSSIREYKEKLALKNINVIYHDEEEEQTRTYKPPFSSDFEIIDNIEIRRADGTIASIVPSIHSCVGHTVDEERFVIIPLINVFISTPCNSLVHFEKVRMGSDLIDLGIIKDSMMLLTFWEDPVIGIKIISNFICDLFGVGLLSLYLFEDHRKLMDVFRGTSIEILVAHDKHKDISDDDLDYIFTNSNAKVLFLRTSSYAFRLRNNYKSNFDSFLVKCAFWVKIEDLMGFDCIEIRIEYPWFSNEDLNRFLKHWISGGSPRLKFFSVNIKDFNEEQALKDIEVQKTTEHTRTYKSVSAYPWGGDIIEVKLGKHQAVLHISRKPFCFLTMHWTGHFDYYWEHMGTGMKVLADYILDLLGVGIYVLNMITRPQQLVDLYEDKPIEIIAFGGKDTNFSAEDLSYVLTKAKAKHFLIYTWPNDFELNESHRTHFELLVMTGAHHLKIEHLMGFDCIEIRIRDKWFSNEELNRFLMHWINVGNPRLRCFIADIKDFDGEQALKDIKVQKTKKKMSTYKSILFALCSQRAATLFKSLRNGKPNPRIVVDYTGDYGDVGCVEDPEKEFLDLFPIFYLSSMSRGLDTRLERVLMGNHRVDRSIIRNDDSMVITIYWDDKFAGFRTISDYLCDCFGGNILLLNVTTDYGKIVETYQGKSIDILAIHDRDRDDQSISDDEFNYILSNAKPKILFINIMSVNVKLTNYPKNHFDSLLVINAYWVKMDYLISLDCIEICIWDREFRNEEMNRFILHWINGGFPRLKLFYAGIENFNERVALKDINVQKGAQNSRIFKSLSTELEFGNLEIRRNDGLIASIKRFEGFVNFGFAVWPDCGDTPNRDVVKAVNYLVDSNQY